MRLLTHQPTEGNDHEQHPATRMEPELLRLLREFLGRPRPEQTACHLLRILDQFIDPAPDEREGGPTYMSEVLVESPNASREVDALRCAGDSGRSRLEELREDVGRQLSQACVSDRVRRDLNDWAQSLTAQRRHENRLVSESLNRDAGGES